MGYAKLQSVKLQKLLRYPIIALASHWVFQSILYMDRTERCFKIGLDLLLTTGFMLLFQFFLTRQLAFALSFLIAHSLNFFLNGHVWGVLKHYKMVYTGINEFNTYFQKLSYRAGKEVFILHVYAYGSLARHEWTPYSDLDVRLVRRPGLWNGLRACWFTLLERSRALFYSFPLDIYLIDTPNELTKLNHDEQAIDLINLAQMNKN